MYLFVAIFCLMKVILSKTFLSIWSSLSFYGCNFCAFKGYLLCIWGHFFSCSNFMSVWTHCVLSFCVLLMLFEVVLCLSLDILYLVVVISSVFEVGFFVFFLFFKSHFVSIWGHFLLIWTHSDHFVSLLIFCLSMEMIDASFLPFLVI